MKNTKILKKNQKKDSKILELLVVSSSKESYVLRMYQDLKKTIQYKQLPRYLANLDDQEYELVESSAGSEILTKYLIKDPKNKKITVLYRK